MSRNEAPVIIVAAGRSGSKMLRTLLASHPKLTAFPREINYIWRYGNAPFPSDELTPKHARPEVTRYIRKRFARFSRQRDDLRLIEKTCANSLRVDFVYQIFPEAQFIHLVRDGRAVAESARRRWRARPELRYLAEKARWLPLRDLPFYAIRYLGYQWERGRGETGAQGSWGPRFEGIDTLVRERSLIEVCAIQWARCVRAAGASMIRLGPDSALTLRYEDLVSEPEDSTRKLLDFLRLDPSPVCLEHARNKLRIDHMDKWRGELSPEEIRVILAQVGEDLTRYGYL